MGSSGNSPATLEGKRGLVLVNTGDGKGKTTAAIGTALRAVGRGKRTCIIQFIKGIWSTGEEEALKRLAPELEFHRVGEGFYKIRGDHQPEEVHREAARRGMELAREKVGSGDYFLVVLDEINCAVAEDLVAVEEVVRLIDERPTQVNLFLTGRHAHPQVVERADMVTEMREVKHPFRQGVSARKGIDY